MPSPIPLGTAPSAAYLEHDNRRFVARLLRGYLDADLLPPTFTVPRFRAALQEFGVISGDAAK